MNKTRFLPWDIALKRTQSFRRLSFGDAHWMMRMVLAPLVVFTTKEKP